MMDRFRILPNYRYYDSADGIIKTAYEKPLRDYKIYGNSVQNGTPSPDNPIEIQNVGDYDEETGKYKISIEVSNENGDTRNYNIFLDEPLRKVGEYADYIDFKNQKVVKNTGSAIFNGTENWTYEKLSYGNNFYINIPDAYPDRNVQVMCNMGLWLSWTMSNPYNIRISEFGNFNFRYEDYDNLTDFKNKLSEMYLNNQPLSVNYVLKTEASIDISNRLPKITEKTTIFTVEAALEPSNIYGKYIK